MVAPPFPLSHTHTLTNPLAPTHSPNKCTHHTRPLPHEVTWPLCKLCPPHRKVFPKEQPPPGAMKNQSCKGEEGARERGVWRRQGRRVQGGQGRKGGESHDPCPTLRVLSPPPPTHAPGLAAWLVSGLRMPLAQGMSTGHLPPGTRVSEGHKRQRPWPKGTLV
uniref:Uncharacterized protein n=1 Tax=Pipistrellus kuhlii TaxID=59472 RepID=A0A7J7SFY8_PIPKU|nr:hypothetical protein mPipKuh1_009970 [Pipistrellus kuhlii]